MSGHVTPAPQPAHRLIPSRFPPIGVLDTVATAADLEAVMELVGWTNDRLVADRLHRLPRSEWVYGVANASIVMAAILHVAPGGMRFNGAALGAWYAADELRTAAAEVGHHLRREAHARGVVTMSRTYRAYVATLNGDYRDIRGERGTLAEVYASDDYRAAQRFGEELRAAGAAGLVYDSVRRRGGVNVVAYRPRNITAALQADHYEVTVGTATRVIDVRRLTAAP